jgi:DNA repair protein RadC|tara:strand:- start:466 stop:1161 length:696 start_codon:yes stop_codon:yes gene_type:complete
MKYSKNISIKDWADEDRPREKLLIKGKAALSDTELIAILIASGNRDESAVELSKRILQSLGNNLNSLAKLSVNDLIKFKGIGEAKAISIIASLELGRRRRSADVLEKDKIGGSKDAFQVLQLKLEDLPHEEFWVMLLNRANKVIDIKLIGRGGVSSTVVDSKVIFSFALESLASGIILAHNHPSGNLKPSNSDIRLTKKLVDAGKILDFPILDHIIVGDNDYFSFADEGLI